MFIYMIVFIISFALGIITKGYMDKIKDKKKYKKIKPLHKQNFKKAMKDLEIK